MSTAKTMLIRAMNPEEELGSVLIDLVELGLIEPFRIPGQTELRFRIRAEYEDNQA